MADLDRLAFIAFCRAALEARRETQRAELAGLDEAAARETKSSAGDKYETAREMIAQSRRLIEHTLAETGANLEALDRMAAVRTGEAIGYGSMAVTSQGCYLIGASLGEWEFQGMAVKTLSLASPLGAELRGRRAGEGFSWRGSEIKILRVNPF